MAGRGPFPSTQNSALLGALSEDEALRRRSWERLARAYHRPIYKHVRLRHHLAPEEAADVTQDFFERCLEREVLERYDASRARFRTYLRLRLDRFVSDERRAKSAVKRGGGLRALPFDFSEMEDELASSGSLSLPDPEAAFDAEWTRSVLGLSLAALERFCVERDKREHYDAFARYHTGTSELSYETLALELGMDVVTLTHRLAYARRHYRRLVLETLSELTASDEELRDEAQRMLGSSA